MWNLSAASNLTFVSQTLSPTAQMFSIEELILAATLYVRMLWKQKQKFLLCATYAIRLFLVPMQAHAVVRRALLLLPYPHYFCSQSNTKMKCWLMYMHSYLYLRFTQQMDHEKERFIILYGDGVKPSPIWVVKNLWMVLRGKLWIFILESTNDFPIAINFHNVFVRDLPCMVQAVRVTRVLKRAHR